MSFANAREPVTFVRSPTLTNSESSPMLSGSRPDESHDSGPPGRGDHRSAPTRQRLPRDADAPRGQRRDRIADRADVRRRRAAAAADEIDEAVPREILDQPRGLRRASRRSRCPTSDSAAPRSDSTRRTVSATRASSSMYGRISAAPSEQLMPTASGRTCRTEFQNASVVWPDSVRPEASVIVPETITGKRRPDAVEAGLEREQRGLAVQRVEDRLDEEEIGAAFGEAFDRLAVRRRRARRSARCARRDR